jgi:hypothetical protein
LDENLFNDRTPLLGRPIRRNEAIICFFLTI